MFWLPISMTAWFVRFWSTLGDNLTSQDRSRDKRCACWWLPVHDHTLLFNDVFLANEDRSCFGDDPHAGMNDCPTACNSSTDREAAATSNERTDEYFTDHFKTCSTHDSIRINRERSPTMIWKYAMSGLIKCPRLVLDTVVRGHARQLKR